MKIVSAEFVQSCVAPGQYPQERIPEVAFVGRSNVGKSSTINSFLHRRGLAKVSTTPGKTRTVNFFRVNTSDPSLKRFSLVDLPGYGYAKVSREIREQWGPMIEGYLTSRSQLGVVVMLIDSRRVEGYDFTMVNWLKTLGQNPILVGTKVDKLSRSERSSLLGRIRESLQVTERETIIWYSAKSHEGRPELWQALRRGLVAKREEMGRKN